MSAPRGIDWDTQPLGEESDVAIAERLGCHSDAVRQARTRRGIPPFRRVDWSLELLGVDTDREIAERLGLSISAVKSARRRRGIPAPSSSRPGTPAARREAAECRRKGWTYADIADVFGVSSSAVGRWLRQEGIQ